MSNIWQTDKAFAPGAQLRHEQGSGTDASQAVTIHETSGVITSSTANLGTDTSESITLTNRLISADSIVLCQVAGGGAGAPVMTKVTAAEGSCVFIVRNVDASNACDAAYTISFVVTGAATKVTG
jgi:hypothetical protein